MYIYIYISISLSLYIYIYIYIYDPTLLPPNGGEYVLIAALVGSTNVEILPGDRQTLAGGMRVAGALASIVVTEIDTY